MITYVKGAAVDKATSYELFLKKDGNLIDIANPTSAPACWAYDDTSKTWTATNSNSANLRWDIALEAGDVAIFSVDVEVASGTFIMTIRDSANSILTSTTINQSGTFTATWTAATAGTYSFRTAGNQTTNSAEYTNISVKKEGVEETYTSLATDLTGEDGIEFDTSALGLEPGTYVFVVVAKADGYKDSVYSNEVTVTIE